MRKIDLGDQWWPASHRSGWAYALHALGAILDKREGELTIVDVVYERK